jgi:hypothetical protein
MKTLRFAVVAVVLTVGVSSFLPPAFGCSGVGASGCREAAPAKLDTLALFDFVALIRAARLLIP